MPQPTKELIRALAEANGLAIPEERLELVLRQYESFLRSLDQINTLPLPLEAEPAIVFRPGMAISGARARARAPRPTLRRR